MDKPKKAEHVCRDFTRKGDFAVCVECGQWLFLG